MEIAPVRQGVDLGLEHILERSKTARHVAIQCAVTGGKLALIAGDQHHRAHLVRQRHEQVAAHPRLNVFLGHILPTASKQRRQRFLKCMAQRINRNHVMPYAQPSRHFMRIIQRHGRGMHRGHHDRAHLLTPQRIHGQSQDQRRINTPRKPQDHVTESTLMHIVARTQHQRLPDLGMIEGLRVRRTSHLAIQLPHGNRRGCMQVQRSIGCLRLHHPEGFRKLRRPACKHSAGLDGKRRAIVHTLIVPSHQMHSDERQVKTLCLRSQILFADLYQTHTVGRTTKHHHQPSASVSHGVHARVVRGILRKQADTHAMHIDVTDATRQPVARCNHFSTTQRQDAAAPLFLCTPARVGIQAGHHHHKPFQRGQLNTERLQLVFTSLNENRTTSQIPQRHTSESAIGQQQQLSTLCMGFACRINNQTGVARKVPRNRIALRHGNGQRHAFPPHQCSAQGRWQQCGNRIIPPAASVRRARCW